MTDMEPAAKDQSAQPFTYAYSRYLSPYSMACESLEDAIGMAAADLDSGEAWPRSISRDGEELWSSAGPLDVSERLAAFATKNGVSLNAVGLSWLDS